MQNYRKIIVAVIAICLAFGGSAFAQVRQAIYPSKALELYFVPNSSIVLGVTKSDTLRFYTYKAELNGTLTALDSQSTTLVGSNSYYSTYLKMGHLQNNRFFKILQDTIVDLKLDANGLILQVKKKSIHRSGLESVGMLLMQDKYVVAASDRVLLLDSTSLQVLDSLPIEVNWITEQGGTFIINDNSYIYWGGIVNNKFKRTSSLQLITEYSTLMAQANQLFAYSEYYGGSFLSIYPLNDISIISEKVRTSVFDLADTLIAKDQWPDLFPYIRSGGIEFVYANAKNEFYKVFRLNHPKNVESFAFNGSKVVLSTNNSLELWDLEKIQSSQVEYYSSRENFALRIVTSDSGTFLLGAPNLHFVHHSSSDLSISQTYASLNMYNFHDFAAIGKTLFNPGSSIYSYDLSTYTKVLNIPTKDIAVQDSFVYFGDNALLVSKWESNQQFSSVDTVAKGSSYVSIAANDGFVATVQRTNPLLFKVWNAENPKALQIIDSLSLLNKPIWSFMNGFGEVYPVVEIQDSLVYVSANDTVLYAYLIQDRSKLTFVDSIVLPNTIVSLNFCGENVIVADGSNDLHFLGQDQDFKFKEHVRWANSSGVYDVKCQGAYLYGSTGRSGYFRVALDYLPLPKPLVPVQIKKAAPFKAAPLRNSIFGNYWFQNSKYKVNGRVLAP